MLPVPGEQKLIAACIVAIQCVKLSSKHKPGSGKFGKRSKGKAGPLVENNHESDSRTTDRNSHKLMQAAVKAFLS